MVVTATVARRKPDAGRLENAVLTLQPLAELLGTE